MARESPAVRIEKLLDAGHAEEALRHCDEFLKQSPGSFLARLGRTRALLLLRNYIDAETEIELALRLSPNDDHARLIRGNMDHRLGHIDEAVRRFEASNPMHLTSLARRLGEERVMSVVAPAISGSELKGVLADDIRYVCELGILEKSAEGGLSMANPVYARSLMRALAEPIRANLAALPVTWRRADGSIDLERLRESFLDFWARHGRALDPLIQRHEIVPHIVMTAWLDRVVNGGGRVEREAVVANGKLDVLLRYRDLTLPIEIKVHLDGRADPVPQGLEQLDRYCEGLRVDSGWLVVFDQRKAATGERLENEEVVTAGGRKVLVVRA